MQMTSDSNSILLQDGEYVSRPMGNFCESRFGGRTIGLTWGSESCNWAGLSNHSEQQNDVYAHRTQRRLSNTDGKVIAKLYALRILFLYRVLYVFKVLAPTCGAVSALL